MIKKRYIAEAIRTFSLVFCGTGALLAMMSCKLVKDDQCCDDIS
jgi:glycerol uptake facilitator-like aquaporin